MEIGKRIVALRQQRGITTNKLANLSGVSQSYLREVEAGEKNPTVEFLSYICHGLRISLADFFSEDAPTIDPYLRQTIKSLSPQQQYKLAEFLDSTGLVKTD